MIEMDIDSIRVSLINSQRVILLKEKDFERYLPIWIGPAEADAIAIKLQGIEVRRPMTHDLLKSLIDAFGGEVESMVITEIKNDTFYAKVNLIVDNKRLEVDSRPSDALALTVRVGTPIFVSESVLDQAGVFLDQVEGNQSAEEQQTNKPVSKEEVDRLSAYSEFLKTLNLDDLDKHQS